MRLLAPIYLKFFEEEAAEVRNVIDLSRKIPLDFRLTEKTRPVSELANHIAQIPRIDIGIYSGELDSGEKAHAMEIKLNRKNIDEILKVFDEGYKYLIHYFKEMTDEDFLIEDKKPFYEMDSEPKAWTILLGKLITHLALHKGILWAYQKTAELDVTMFNYYGAKMEE